MRRTEIDLILLTWQT